MREFLLGMLCDVSLPAGVMDSNFVLTGSVIKIFSTCSLCTHSPHGNYFSVFNTSFNILVFLSFFN